MTDPFTANKLLASLPPADHDRLRPQLQAVTIKSKETLFSKDDVIERVYFPSEGICSLVAHMDDGRMTEIATVGHEGVVGYLAGLGQRVASHTSMLQVPAAGKNTANAHVMSADTFRAEMAKPGAFRDAINRYIVAAHVFVEMSVGCNALHDADERCARWLLTVQDRLQSPTFQLSHEFLAMMLGVHRPTATIVAGSLQNAGLIRYRRGQMEILNREGLEEAACECYATLRPHFAMLSAE